MNLGRTLATSRRVLAQLRHDHRTLALVLFIPTILLTIMKYAFEHQPAVFNAIAPMILGIFPLIVMFVVTSIAMLRERRTGTLDRLMTMPIGKLDLIVGYGLAFALLALLQSAIASAVVLGLLGVTVLDGTLPLLVCAVAAALLGTALGLLMSAFATSEFQSVQFMPAIVLPQLLVCGLFVAREDMARPLQWFADVMPLTYSVDAMQQITRHQAWTATLSRDLIVVIGCAVAALILGSVTIRRQE